MNRKMFVVHRHRENRLCGFVPSQHLELYSGNVHQIKLFSGITLECVNRRDPDTINRFLIVMLTRLPRWRFRDEKPRIESPRSA